MASARQQAATAFGSNKLQQPDVNSIISLCLTQHQNDQPTLIIPGWSKSSISSASAKNSSLSVLLAFTRISFTATLTGFSPPRYSAPYTFPNYHCEMSSEDQKQRNFLFNQTCPYPRMFLAASFSRMISAFLNNGVRISGVSVILRLMANGSVRISCAMAKAFWMTSITALA